VELGLHEVPVCFEICGWQWDLERYQNAVVSILF
jgi:hypothetical protein